MRAVVKQPSPNWGAIVRRQRVLFNAIYQEHKGLLFTGR
jgi:hypothetical protein